MSIGLARNDNRVATAIDTTPSNAAPASTPRYTQIPPAGSGGRITVAVTPAGVTLLVAAGGGIAAFRTCEASIESEAGEKIVNGASDIMVEVLGDKGRHTRAAVGVSSLPLGSAVEVDAIIAIG